MKHFILAITGPAGAGKSTVAARLSKEINRCVNIEADTVKHMIVNGFAYDGPEGVTQWQLLGLNIGMLAKNFHEARYNVIINGYINEPAWENIQKQVRLSHKVLLLPSIDTATRRDAERQEEYQLGRKEIQRHHDYFSHAGLYDTFTKIDSSEHSVEETSTTIKRML